VIAPAMNVNMWQHPATQVNLETLRKRGHRIVEPTSGFLACGMTGPGRLAEPETIAQAVAAALQPPEAARIDLEGESVLVTAGPTQEPLDPVRYISNRSSGKMGYALAEAATARGARVVLVSGPVNLAPPAGVDVIQVRTAAEMRDAVFENLPRAGIVIKSAAVADFHLSKVPDQKVKKTAARVSLELDPTPDILAELGRKKGDRLLIGFAAETQNLQQEARRKLESKNCDMVVGNLVGAAGMGFESDQNEVTLVLSTGEIVELPRASKREIADRIFDEILKLRLSLHASHGR
jgi:phosphopantothenoylcysteine decarboxylase/phosphopantothenate--cysteine ligase